MSLLLFIIIIYMYTLYNVLFIYLFIYLCIYLFIYLFFFFFFLPKSKILYIALLGEGLYLFLVSIKAVAQRINFQLSFARIRQKPGEQEVAAVIVSRLPCPQRPPAIP